VEKFKGGKVCLSKSGLNKLKNYCGLTMRTNFSNLEAIKRDMWEVFFTVCQEVIIPNMVFTQDTLTFDANL
jgi:hypothetical protein